MRKNDAFDAKIVNKRLTKIFIAIFAPDERLPSSATLRKSESAFKIGEDSTVEGGRLMIFPKDN